MMAETGRRNDLSVIIVNWNTRDILMDCLESLNRSGTECRMEVLVVDNGSEDGSVSAVRERFPEVKLIENGTNLGYAKANNMGINQASGRYICLMNSDVKVRAGCLDSMIRYMDVNSGVGMLGPRILNADLTVQDSCRRFPSLWTHLILALGLAKMFPKSRVFYGEHMAFFGHDETRDVDYIAGCVMLVRREAIDQIGMMDERFFIYCEEVDWCRRLWQRGWSVHFFPGAEAIHLHGASSGRDPVRFSVERQRAYLQYWQKHHGYPERVVLSAILLFHHAVRLLNGSFLYLLRPKQREAISTIMATHKACVRALISPGIVVQNA